MKTIISIQTEFGEAEFSGDSPEAADKALKAKLRQIRLSIKKLSFYRETEFGGELHIFYGYMPTTFRYEHLKAAAL